MRAARGQIIPKNNGKTIQKDDSAPPYHQGDSTISSLEASLTGFSEEERHAILSVVKRDLEVRCMEKHRLKQVPFCLPRPAKLSITPFFQNFKIFVYLCAHVCYFILSYFKFPLLFLFVNGVDYE